MRAIALTLMILLAMPGCSAQGESRASPDEVTRIENALLPRPDGPILDQADLLPVEEEAELDARLRQLVENSDNALIIVTVDSLGGRSLEDYAFRLFSDWGIGDAETNRGLLILVAVEERKIRISVGCGLESTVSDALASEIIQQRITPKFRDGDFPAGIKAGADALIAQLALPKPANDPGPHSEICKAQAREAA